MSVDVKLGSNNAYSASFPVYVSHTAVAQPAPLSELWKEGIEIDAALSKLISEQSSTGNKTEYVLVHPSDIVKSYTERSEETVQFCLRTCLDAQRDMHESGLYKILADNTPKARDDLTWGIRSAASQLQY